MATEKSLKNPLIILGLGAVLTLIFLIMGIWCLCLVDDKTIQPTRHEERYDQCIDEEFDVDCSEFNPSPAMLKCACTLQFVLKEDLKGKVTLYYELESFDQTNSTYANSRDDSQLQGNPGQTPASSCGNYSYFENKTIFPCGQVADTMFSDTFRELAREDVNPRDIIPVSYTDLFTEDTPTFKNPKENVYPKFAYPINWVKRLDGTVVMPWESDTELKGVENPAFRAWMDTKLKRKPVWRVENKGKYSDGLPAGNYSLNVYIYYGVNKYNGVRKIILEGVQKEYVARSTAGGVILLLLAIGGMMGLAFCLYRLRKRKAPTENDADGVPPSNDDKEVPLLQRIRNRFHEFRSSK